MKEETKMGVCGSCGSSVPTEYLTKFDDHLFCWSCLAEQTILCHDCGDRIYRSQNEGTSDIPLCQDCYDNHYTHCERCGRMIHNDEAHYLDSGDYPYCRSCYEVESERSIKEYNYKPDPIFYGDGNRFFGVELEIDEGGEDDSSAEEVVYVGNRSDEHIYCKHDGSLHDGFEIVTHPMTLDYHLNTMPWKEITDKARKLGYTSHQAETCGLHIHVNRTSFGETVEDQDAAIGRVLYFVERNWNELLLFSRRTQEQLESWARRYGYKDQPKEMLEHAKKGYAGRYTCVNLTNYSTIEFRIFRGTLKLNTIYATLQLVNHICEVAVFMSDEEVRNLSWSRFVDLITEPELILDIMTKNFMKHSYQFLTLYEVQANFTYDTNTPTPIFDKYIFTITGGDAELMERIMQSIGYILSPDNNGKCFFLLQGVPNSGKSVLANFIQRLFSYNAVVQLEAQLFGEKFTASEIIGKALCSFPDIPASPLSDATVSRLKLYTGNDPISAPIRYKENEKFICTAKFLFATNHAFLTRSEDQAFNNRIVTIPFKYSIPKSEQQFDIENAMFSERDGIVSKAMAAYFRLTSSGYNFAGSYAPNEVVALTETDEIDCRIHLFEFTKNNFVAMQNEIVFTDDAYNFFNKRLTGMSKNDFSHYFQKYAFEMYNAQKDRKRKPGATNPTSCLVGIAFKSEV